MIKSFSGSPFAVYSKSAFHSFPLHYNQQTTASRTPASGTTFLCRQPEGGKMAQCDGCKEWYHDEYANFPDDIESVAWFCPSC